LTTDGIDFINEHDTWLSLTSQVKQTSDILLTLTLTLTLTLKMAEIPFDEVCDRMILGETQLNVEQSLK
jgi:hypothetical protein